MDIHVKNGETVDVDTALILTRWDNTLEYFKWKMISLSAYKGKEIKIAFRQAVSLWGRSRLFVVDNFSICNAETTDVDEDGIPDNLDYSPNGELLPPPENFAAVTGGELSMDLSWSSLDRQVHPIAGYKIYRRCEDSTRDFLLNVLELLPPETESFRDDSIRNATGYAYKIVAVSSDGQRGIAAESNSAYVDYNLTPFPFEESFDSVSPGFVIPDDSGWSISEAHGEWGNFSGNYHLDSNPDESDQVLELGSRHIVRASMMNRVHIPVDAENPTLSFWYKMDLRTLDTDDLGYDDFWDYQDDFNFLAGLLYGDRIYIDIHFVLYRMCGDPIEMVHRYARTYTPEDNSTDYIWDSLPLDLYKGTEIWIDFRKKTGCSGEGSTFALDDFRISDAPRVDDNGNGIPDAYESPLGADKLPYVKNFKAESTDIGSVELSWDPVAGNPGLEPAGYLVYRQIDGEDDFQQLTDAPLPYDAAQWTDTTMTVDGTYRYYVVGATTDGAEGYPTQVHSVDVVIPAPVITTQPQNTEALEGEEASFTIDAKGLHLAYQWHRNGDPISGATTTSYTLSQVSLADHGAKFSCQVTNGKGSVVSEPAVLTAHLAPPVISGQPLSQAVMERSKATFHVTATGSNLTYQWQKDAVPVPGATESSYVLDPVPYTGFDGSTYRCLVSNAWNGESHVVTSQGAVLDVILAPPVITEQPHAKHVTEHEPVTFTVTAVGTGLTYQWLRDGVEIPGAEGFSYAIGSTDLADHGRRFSCRIDNTLDVGATQEGGVATSHSVMLSVDLAPPVITTQPVAQTVTERGSVTFTAMASGSHLAYQWQKNGAAVEAATQNTLTLDPASYDDDGAVFRCLISNAWNGQSHSVISAEAVLDVILAPPVITLDTPHSVTQEEGKPLDLSVETIGTFVTYQWFKNGILINGATDAALHIDVVALDDHEATYHCVAENTREINGKIEGGKAQSVITQLTVNLAPPVITTQPVTQTVTERGSVSFTAMASGSHLAYQWQKNGAVIEGATQNTLTLDPASYNDDGAVFRCLISNAWNGQSHSVISAEAALDVILAPPVITLDTPPTATREEGQSLALSVETLGSFVTYQWFKNGILIDGATNANLHVDAVALDDHEATYHCVASNTREINGKIEGGKAQSASTQLTVTLAPPVITTQPVAQTVMERGSVTFTTVAAGSHLSYQWQKNGAAIEGQVENTLTLDPVLYEDDGAVYRCIVSNAWNGESHFVESASVAMDVLLAPPAIEQQPTDVTVVEREASTFSVKAIGTNLTYQWMLGGKDVAGATGTSWTRSSTPLSDDDAVVTCRISNAMDGSTGPEGGTLVTDPATLVVTLAPPVITEQPKAAKVTEREPVTFTVKTIGSHLNYQWLKNGKAMDGDVTVSDNGLESTCTLAKADYEDDGVLISCAVTNSWEGVDHIVTSADAPLDVVLAPPLILTQPPAAREVTERDSFSLEVETEGTFCSWQWYIGEESIEGANQPKLVIDSTPLSYHGGIITCRTSNVTTVGGVQEGGVVTTTPTSLTVHLAPPLIETQPASLTVDEKASAEFSVGVIGSQLDYTWFRDGAPIAGATSSTLKLKNVLHDQSGEYHCVVTNGAGSQTSRTVDLIVVVDPESELTLEGPEERVTNDFMISLSGYALAPGTTVQSISAVNDRYTGQSFGITLDASGAIVGEVPLELGLNTITLTMVLSDGTIVTKVITVTAGTASLPVISITSPVTGTVVTTDQVTFAGKIRSSLPPEQIRVIHDENLTFPTGADGEYAFSFEHSGLIKGHNLLKVIAETPLGNVSAQAAVIYIDEEDVVQAKPTIEVYSPLPGRMVTENVVAVKGMVRGEAAITAVEVNGTPATLTGSGTQVSFKTLVDINAGEQATIRITATDATGETGELTYEVGLDQAEPVIQITSQALLGDSDPLVIVENPFAVTGRIIEANLAGAAVEMRDLAGKVLMRTQPAITPAQGDAYNFTSDLILPAGSDVVLFVEAWDMAGKRTDRSFSLRYDGGVAIEVISPMDGSRKTVSGQAMELPITLRIPGIQESDTVTTLLDGVPLTELTRSGATVHGSPTVSSTEGARELSIDVHNAKGELLAQTRSRFMVVSLDNVAFKVIRQEPANNAEGVEPNAFIAFYFNKEADPSKLSVEVYETVHGKVWTQPEKGADITAISAVSMEEIHRSHELVPGGVSVLPGNTMVAFYPERDLGYTATVTVKLLNGEEELSRSVFTVRPRPTFIKGMLSTQFTEPLDGLKITVPELGRTTVSSDGGNFAFGFGDKADAVIPPGKYRLIVNPAMENPEFGTVESWINVQEGMLNQMPVIKVPVLNPEEPFRLVVSRKADNLLAGNELNLNLEKAILHFPDGRSQGSVHTQFTPLDKIGCGLNPVAVPHWVFAIQPIGIEVRGTMDLTVKMPKLYGTHEYVENLGDRVVLVGYDPDAMQLVPVGVGLVDKEHHKVNSERPVSVRRLDYLGYAVVEEARQPLLKEYADGTISMAQLTFELQ
ncbi:immunoglobulin domain-containing protein [Desulfoluna butyratoxydans]|uniref:immunoglobulin domain-containing protein n=1 Tax=Desulfoluna butyratoxydans TaxID=231438 RepID=UPI0015D0F0BB|nr:immunoglobulin domain-containing protein [Desulfoluna butyratoxydans]